MPANDASRTSRKSAGSFTATRTRSISSRRPTSTCWAWTNGCKNFKYICYIDCYDGRHPNVFCPSEQPHAEFQSIEDINNYLLQHKEVIDFIKRRGGKPKFVFLMFDEETERLSKELGAEVWFPKAKLRTAMDNKIETVRIGNKAGRAVGAQRAGRGQVLRGSAQDLREGRDRPRPGAAIGLRRQRPHHVLHQVRGRFPPPRARDRRRGRDQDHEADRLPRLGDRGLRHQGRHHRRPADDRTGRASRS